MPETPLSMQPGSVEEAMAIGIQHLNSGRLPEAERIYRQVLTRQPDNVTALYNLGLALGQSGQFAAAIDLFSRVIRRLPNSAEAHNNLANALHEDGQIDLALIHFSRAVELKPDFPSVLFQMGTIYLRQGRQEQAVRCFRQGVALNPAAADMYGNLLYSLHFCSDSNARQLLVEHRAWAAQYEPPLVEQRRPHVNDPDPERPLRIGYVSAHFGNHPVGSFLLPLFAHHDHQQFQIWCYSDRQKAPDSITQRLRQGADSWRDVQGVSDEALAEQVRNDRIDILLDLAQHSSGCRLLAFARKPAPVQVAWLGYPSTTGLQAMDYRLTDPFLDPPGQGDEDYTERSIRLPHCFWCYEAPERTPDVNPLPARKQGYVTFGCMNRMAKVTQATLHIWRRILAAVPNSRLLLHSKIGDHLEAVRRLFEAEGIASRRLEFVEFQPVLGYLRQYARMDIALDPFPHGGGTITCDSLWMGVPVVTLSGQTAVGRGGTSLLSNVGLPELIAHTPEEYFSTAVALAGDLAELESLRASLRSRVASSPLTDGKRFAADMETAYREMWRKWCAESPGRETR